MQRNDRLVLFGIFGSNDSGFTITEAGVDDLADCAAIHEKSFTHAWDEQTLASMLGTRGTAVLFARPQRAVRRPVQAFLMYRIAGKEAEILTVAADPAIRGKGAARRLIDEMVRRCLTDRLTEVFLEVDSSNEPALRLYRKAGFVKVGERAGYYRAGRRPQEGAGNALILRLDLTG